MNDIQAIPGQFAHSKHLINLNAKNWEMSWSFFLGGWGGGRGEITFPELSAVFVIADACPKEFQLHR